MKQLFYIILVITIVTIARAKTESITALTNLMKETKKGTENELFTMNERVGVSSCKCSIESESFALLLLLFCVSYYHRHSFKVQWICVTLLQHRNDRQSVVRDILTMKKMEYGHFERTQMAIYRFNEF